MPVSIDVPQLSISILHILKNQARPVFSQSTKAAPSFWVFVHLVGRALPGYEAPFPIQFRGTIWNDVAVPVLLDDSLRQNIAVQRTSVAELLLEVQAAVEAQMVVKGYLL